MTSTSDGNISHNASHNISGDLSRDYAELKDNAHFDVIVVGSGYGGSITASRLARAKAKDGKPPSVCLLERGLEIRPGQYPSSLMGVKDNTQIRTDKHGNKPMGKATAMFDLRVNEDVSALVGCGLGGTSLINANVALTATKGIFTRPGKHWPKIFRDKPSLLDPYYALARLGLGANPYPEPDDPDKPGYKTLNKLTALEKSARAMGARVYKPDINVSFNHGPNYFGENQTACNLCGDCCTGCNVGAKNTTLMNYLPDAYNHGASIFCNTTVEYVERKNNGWQLHINNTEGEQEAKVITADTVILAAGTLGSTEILMRSRQQGLTVSDKLGQQFSGNGDVLAFGYNSYWRDNNELIDPRLRSPDAPRFEPIYAVGMGENVLTEEQMPGPCITGVIDLRDPDKPLDQQLIIEEGVAPGAFSSLLPAAFLFSAAEEANFLRYGTDQAAMRLQDVQQLASAVQGGEESLSDLAYKGAVGRTQNYLVMSVDDSAGELQLDQHSQRINIHWPDAGTSPVIQHDNTVVSRANDAIQGQFITNPLWQQAFGNKLITVHPLGGCPMGDDANDGVVDHKGQVFSSKQGTALHEGLFVCDGAVMPGALGVNPLLTISAFAERSAELIADSKAWTIDYTVNGQPKPRIEPLTPLRIPPSDKGPFPDTSKESTFALLGVASIGMLAYKVSQERKAAYMSAPTEKENRLWKLQNQVSTTLLDLYSSEYVSQFAFAETMSGYLQELSGAAPDVETTNVTMTKADYQLAAAEGKAAGNTLQVNLTIASSDIDKIIKDRQASCGIITEKNIADLKNISRTSTILYPSLSDHPINISDGEFTLLCPDADAVETWLMKYRLHFSVEGKDYLLLGRKTLQQKKGSHWWTDLTELMADLYCGEQHCGMGLITLNLQDFINQLGTFNAELHHQVLEELLGTLLLKQLEPDQVIALRQAVGLFYLAKLAGVLGAIVFRVYGGLLSDLNNYPRQEWLSRQGLDGMPYIDPKKLPSYHHPDNSKIRLTRYQAGAGIPVILAPGLGVNASSFATDSVDYNLVEFLTWGQRDGSTENPPLRDVWLLDYRACFDSGSSTEEFSLDDIAKEDWSAAIEYICELTKQPNVQIMAHCVSSMTLLMGLLRGWVDKTKIQSIICSQLTLHPITNWLNNAKVDLSLVEAMASNELIQAKGNVVDMNSGITEFDRAFDILCYQAPPPPGEECNNPLCHRVLTAYGPSYLHAQLNQATHIRLGEWFQDINLNVFDQLSKIMRLGYVVDAEGRNIYFSNIPDPASRPGENTIPNLDLPITFLAGALNLEFLPETSKRTFDWIVAHNPHSGDKYYRHVVPHYGHMDCFIGKNAAKDIFPLINTWLNQYNKESCN